MKKRFIFIISTLVSAIIGLLGGVTSVARVKERQIADKQKISDKHLDLYMMMNQWVKVKQDGKNLSQYFEKNGYFKIAIYGMSYAGESLINELKESRIEIIYGIDKNAGNILSEVEVLSLDEDLKAVDAIVVTAISYFDEIKIILNSQFECPVLSLEDILYEV